jgi:hypothetical protein
MTVNPLQACSATTGPNSCQDIQNYVSLHALAWAGRAGALD